MITRVSVTHTHTPVVNFLSPPLVPYDLSSTAELCDLETNEDANTSFEGMQMPLVENKTITIDDYCTWSTAITHTQTHARSHTHRHTRINTHK